MTTPTQTIHAALLAHVGLTALLTNGDSPETFRIYNLVIPQDASDPCLVTQKLAQTRENTMAPSGGQGVENQRVRVTIYGKTIAEAEAASEQARLAMTTATTFESVPIFGMDQFDNGTQLYQVIVDYSVWYRH